MCSLTLGCFRLVLTWLNGAPGRGASRRDRGSRPGAGPNLGRHSRVRGGVVLRSASALLQRNTEGRKAGRAIFHALRDGLADLLILVGHLGGDRRGGGRLGCHVEG